MAWIIEWIAQELELEGLEEIMLAFVAKNYYFLTTDINEDGAYFTPGWGGGCCHLEQSGQNLCSTDEEA